jgi:hypothetical protein
MDKKPPAPSTASRIDEPHDHFPRCSFCSKRRSEVDAMFEGPGAFVCNECVALFVEQIAKRRAGG